MAASDLLQILTVYLEINVLMGMAFLFWKASQIGFNFLFSELKYQHQLNLGRWLMVAAVLLPLVASFVPREELFRPSAQIWSSSSKSNGESYALLTKSPSRISTPHLSGELGGLRLSRNILAAILMLIILAAIVRLVVWFGQWQQLKKFIGHLPTLRTIGQVAIVGSENNSIPFAARVGGKALIALPINAFLDRRTRRLVLAHEGQHHRQADTVWVHGFELLKTIAFANPLFFYWLKQLIEIQELSCDEYLIGQENISPREYGRCLLQTAQHALSARRPLVGTTSMAVSPAGHFLKRRIAVILKNKTAKAPTWAAVLASFGTLALLATTALASRSLVQTHRLTLIQARALADKTSSTIPITVNELVLKQLNRLIGTPEGRKYVSSSLTRMPQYQPMIEKWLNEYHFPKELLAVPIIESGYTDFSAPKHVGAGLWGFIPQTALKYGLMVQPPNIDDRLDEEKETEAAMRYFKYLNDDLFHDWRLALKAYNEGEDRVNKLIEKYGTTDAWKLEEYAEGPEHYLSTITALILIMKNPSVMG